MKKKSMVTKSDLAKLKREDKKEDKKDNKKLFEKVKKWDAKHDKNFVVKKKKPMKRKAKK